MIVWHLLSNRWNSAITEYALSAARALEMAGHQSVFTPLARSPAERRAKGYGLKTLPIAGFSPLSIGQLKRIVYEVKPGAIFTYGGAEMALTPRLKAIADAKVLRFRGQALEPKVFQLLRHQFGHRHVDRMVAPSRALADELMSLDPTKQVEAVVLGCDESKFHRVESIVTSPRPDVVVLGRLDPVKGHKALFEIFALMLNDWTRPAKPRLHVVGEPANLSVEQLRAESRAAGLVDDDVMFTPSRVEAIADVLSSAAVGVVPSTGSEIIARVAEEFLLCGTPIVVSGVGSLEETLFEDAGGSYRGMDQTGAARLLKSWIERSVDEGEMMKARRATKAVELYSLRTMGKALGALL